MKRKTKCISTEWSPPYRARPAVLCLDVAEIVLFNVPCVVNVQRGLVGGHQQREAEPGRNLRQSWSRPEGRQISRAG